MNKRLLLLFFLLPIVFAADYYADVEINVDLKGVVSINGLTNHPMLTNVETNNFTSFNNSYWLLNISISENFSNYVYEIHLPSSAVINYLSTPNIMSISSNGNIIITAIGADEPFKAIVQYSLDENPNYFLVFLAIFLPIIVIGLLYFNKDKISFKIDYSVLTKRQADIMRLVAKHKKITQKRLENILDMPKSALSRNIESLTRKDLIEKKRKGVTNMIVLKEVKK